MKKNSAYQLYLNLRLEIEVNVRRCIDLLSGSVRYGKFEREEFVKSPLGVVGCYFPSQMWNG